MKKPVFFTDARKFRQWLKKNHANSEELLVGYHKKRTGKKSINWSDSVDQALCFGWIDGVRRSINEESYCIRFTPRRPGSNWSDINLEKIKKLKKQGLLEPAGEKIFNARKKAKTSYSYEKAPEKLEPRFEKLFREDTAAWNWFRAMPASYRNTAIHWVMSAKRAETREKRFATLLADSSEGRKIKPLSY